MARLTVDQMPGCEMVRVVVHWTAGTHKASPLDKDHYHILIEGDGTVVAGNHPIAANARPPRQLRASHTRNLNTGSIGVAVCCMKDARERPFSPGPFPMTPEQWKVAAEVVAELCTRYEIPVTARTVLAHGEVEATLGVAQLQKWDPLVLPWTPLVPRQQVMEQFRASVQQHAATLKATLAESLPAPPPPAGAAVAPQRVWPGDSAVLLVHGVGNAKAGDYVDVLQAVQAAAPQSAVYQLFYDQYSDWFNQKHDFGSLFNGLKTLFAANEGNSELSETVAEFAGDVLWPMFMNASREVVLRAYIAQVRQIIKDGVHSNRPANNPRLPSELKLAIVCHSLGCFHTYELLHRLADQPFHKLRPATDGVRFKSVVFMASPVQLIRTLGSAIGSLVPPGLATMSAAGLRIPAEETLGMRVPSVQNWVTATGDLDPIGGHFLRKKEAWAYMTVAGEKPPIVVPQQLVGAGGDEAKLIAVLKASRSEMKPPSLNNPHSWLDYITQPLVNLPTWLA
jgi:hypothetical protein